MPVHNADALVLRTYRLGESDRLVVFLTRDRGKKRGVAKNARQSRRRFGGALEPLTYGRVSYLERERRDLVHIEYLEPIRSPLAVGGARGGAGADGAGRPHGEPADAVDALGYVGYFAELIDECAPDNDPSETLFRLGVSVLDALVAGVAPASLARYFEYWLLCLQGVYRAPVDPSAPARAFLATVRRSSPLGLLGVAVEPGTLAELAAEHRAQIGEHLEKDLKSVRVLRQLRL
jgi:DNA repair protein RecO (recombination protein O)